MKVDNVKDMNDLYNIVEELLKEQRKLIKLVDDLRNEHEELKDEIRIQNFVLNSIPFRTEALN